MHTSNSYVKGVLQKPCRATLTCHDAARNINPFTSNCLAQPFLRSLCMHGVEDGDVVAPRGPVRVGHARGVDLRHLRLEHRSMV